MTTPRNDLEEARFRRKSTGTAVPGTRGEYINRRNNSVAPEYSSKMKRPTTKQHDRNEIGSLRTITSSIKQIQDKIDNIE